MADLTDVTIWSTFVCSLLSLIGSMLVVASYMIARLTAKPKTAALISNLSLTDFLWFLSSLVQSSFWIAGQDVPDRLCYVCSPVVNFARMASLIWTCAISFDVLMSVQKRKWLWRGEENGWKEYRMRYYLAVASFALPCAGYNIFKQHSGESSLGCSPGYEELGGGVVVFFTELLPIVIGFTINVYIFFKVRARMAAKAFPLSVRKKRRKIMYHYVIVCIVCWTPTMVFYIAELSGLHSAMLEVFSRISLYLTGFLNFLVFGMQDPHLKRSLSVVLYYFCGAGRSELKTTAIDKTVMFGGDLSENADIAKDKKAIYRYHKLTKEDKAVLYSARPDLDPKTQYLRANKITEPLLSPDDRAESSFGGIEDCEEEKARERSSASSATPATSAAVAAAAAASAVAAEAGEDANEYVNSSGTGAGGAGGGGGGKAGLLQQQLLQQPRQISSEMTSSFSSLNAALSPLKVDSDYIQYKSDDTESSSDEDDEEDMLLSTSMPELFALASSPAKTPQFLSGV